MRRGLADLVPLVCLLLQVPLTAQHGGTGGHSGGVAHAASAPTFSAPSRSFTPPAHSLSSQTSRPRHWPSGSPSHPAGGERNGRNRQRYPYVYAGYPWLSYGYGLPLAYGSPYAPDPDDTGGPSPALPQQADEPAADDGVVAANTAPPFRPPYNQVEAAPVHPQPATTLIFRDGRPPQHVHNYALTGSILYALDGDARQEIPLALLNLPATMEANRAAGVDFAIPLSR